MKELPPAFLDCNQLVPPGCRRPCRHCQRRMKKGPARCRPLCP